MIYFYSRGHKAILKDGKWIYEDIKQPVDENRPCKRCGQPPTKEGHDTCLGHIDGVESACCGHGMVDPFILYKDDNTMEEFDSVEELKKYVGGFEC